MKIRELRAISNGLAFSHHDFEDLDVVVETANPGIPHCHLSPVIGATAGFDWTASYFILGTADQLVVEKKLDKPIRDFAKEYLEALKAAWSRSKFTYISKNQERSWLDGFVEGVKKHVTGCLEEEAKLLKGAK